MLPVEKTAHEGAGLSVPCVIEREAEHYVALPAAGPMSNLPEFAPPKFRELHDLLADMGIADIGDGFFRYRSFSRQGHAELEVGNLVKRGIDAAAEIIAGEIPAGRYAFATHTGPYDRLHDAFLMLEGWMGGRGLEPEGMYGPEETRPACQLEIYRIHPMMEQDPRLWKTDILVKLAD
ncbi:GyrI-like domain-containing protein [Oricola thermophila]|uniref:GyrI-like domain-containing protein n=1 Tax=Oricola thermophila TaxID=2742145 RepID=A0A6N1VLC5_9HYPH|nr:GyrI-like domain-containing protein [Oricola thermophila]QKV19757.1 GyrI-like domain-containing protein [Oricola thermophila]